MRQWLFAGVAVAALSLFAATPGDARAQVSVQIGGPTYPYYSPPVYSYGYSPYYSGSGLYLNSGGLSFSYSTAPSYSYYSGPPSYGYWSGPRYGYYRGGPGYGYYGNRGWYGGRWRR